MQPVDFTTLAAVCSKLRENWLPARCEQVVQRDRFTICIALRTLQGRGWLTISWHPQAARIHMGDAPPKVPDTFTFSQQLKHQLGGLALVSINAIAPWERVLDLQFARRPGDSPQGHLYVEIMGKYSNAILTNAQQQIVTAAHQVSEQQSSVRPIQTGDRYQMPPKITQPTPEQHASQSDWQEPISLVPGPLKKRMIQAYGGLSSALLRSLIQAAHLDPQQSTDSLTATDWGNLFDQWQQWLTQLVTENFQPGFTAGGYTVIGVGITEPTDSIQQLLKNYYTHHLNQYSFDQWRNQISQKLKTVLKKLKQKESTFLERLEQSEQAEYHRQQADLLMAYQHLWQPGMQSITLEDFETSEPVTIPLKLEKNGVQNAQAFYKQHQKLKRVRQAVAPLLNEVRAEIHYLEQVESALNQVTVYERPEDLDAIADIRDELIEQGYLSAPYQRERNAANTQPFQCHHAQTPGGHEVLIGRNNRQNDHLISKIATDYDLWFHTQEIPGSHVLLRLNPGDVPDEIDLQCTANLAAYYSRARQADQVPVVYTAPKHVYKPKGARPGMVIYKHEQVLWGQPQLIHQMLEMLDRKTQPGTPASPRKTLSV
ncbi:MAG: NFACT RNA binding domain-containing protein [Cyanobacteria bacterium J06635_15]